MKLFLIAITALALGACSTGPVQANDYRLNYSAQFTSDEDKALATITLDQQAGQVRSVDFKAPATTYNLISADGAVEATDQRMVWTPPSKGGSISYEVQITNAKGDAYDAKHTPDWLIMRLDDLFPAATVRTIKGVSAQASLTMGGPTGWSFESPYGDVTNQLKPVEGERKYLRPTGWLVGGNIGTRRDAIAGRLVTLAAPTNSGFRRLDTMAFLNWTLPEVAKIFTHLPKQLLIVGAPEEMWRGGLSGPSSLYLHVTRPLISENGTSPVLHELIHTAGLHSAGDGGDWIVEGLAEYYSLVVLRRTGGLSEPRFKRAIEFQRNWAQSGDGKLADPSKGADTAYAVTVFHNLALELKASGHNLDAVIHALIEAPQIDAATLNEIVRELLGRTSKVLPR